MPTFTAPDGLTLHYADAGEGPAVILLHGITASGEINWEWTGIGPAIRSGGFRTIALDQRGHGHSDQPTDPDRYADEHFAADVSALADVLDLDSFGLVGYSMGALMGMRTVVVEPRVHALVLGGIGSRDLRAIDRTVIAEGLEADDPASITDADARELRQYAQATGADRHVMAALQRGRRGDPFQLDQITVPTMVIAGEDDRIAGDPHSLAHKLPHGEGRTVSGDHAGALIDPSFGGEIVRFLSRQLR